MALETNGVKGAIGVPQRPAFGPVVWGWGLVGGLTLWSLGFVHLPWWAALLLWWWPSLLFGAGLGWAAIGLARLVPRLIEARQRSGTRPGPPS